MSGKKTYKVVIDTNVFVSSFFGGLPRQTIDLWKNGQIILCLSQDIVEEYMEVLIRLGVTDKKSLEDLSGLFARGWNCLYAGVTPDLSVIQEDSGDDKFLECAIALDAGFIISGDQHLKKLKKYFHIRIMSPREFMDFLNEV
ncbi:Nucleotide binding protein PINc [Desulfonatronospira thiodismutans ASO3-1]|uniref:Nucleotide binding protein PINc n=1 Tax=Desulfonatronospira thiodismutans ASO3-1 TaxID=555779 RepID=D6SK95_9BACT|nr:MULTISPECIES: putative toxin-antitoxin system toxin component, PIN family [Desulfonatronospira]EFI36298.1 Nucleotide binding protein PINc [Desulfonatronospira thiodismutans ASO3-1]RQD74215.1 MAG: putative toxin-antitoxin system toxin component, PIN family [Desulfonatronospira sp. MSAO_Bac3]